MYDSSPIIIAGMHRSGTTLTARLLSDLGLFLGKRKFEDTHESKFFVSLNEFILLQAGIYWDNPKGIEYVCSQSLIKSNILEYLRFFLKSPRTISYLGVKNYMKFGGISSFQGPWGWKDPRNTITLPFWTTLFPSTKLIYLLRHGVDVANSLKVRWEKQYSRKRMVYSGYKWLYAAGFNRRLGCSWGRISNLEDAFSLWLEYVELGAKNISLIDSSKVFILKYEDLLANPVTIVGEMAEFAHIRTTHATLERVLQDRKVIVDRGYAYKNVEELRRFADRHQYELKQAGYE